VDHVRDAYSRWSQPYIETLGTVDSVDPADLAFIDRHLGGVDGRVLDLGCGPGHLTAFLHARGRDVTGLDLVPEFVAHARTTHPDVAFEAGSLLEVEHEASGVLAWFSLIHLDDLDTALAKVRGMLVPGGVVVAGFFTGPVHETFAHRVVTAHRYPVDELVDRFTTAGLAVVAREERVQ
jgi:trans-aconitate methyltransferase